MADSLSIAIPCRSSEPGLFATLESLQAACAHEKLLRGLIAELLVCINGICPGEESPALVAVRDFCQRFHICCEEVWIDNQEKRESEEAKRRRGEEANIETETVTGRTDKLLRPAPSLITGSPNRSLARSFPKCTVLLTERSGKPPAWNTLWRRARGTVVLFSDADVRIDCEAVWALYRRMQHEPTLHLVAAREVPVVVDNGTLWSRMGAIPYRFNFGNAGGRLFMLRKTVLPDGMPENLLLEDAWLTVAVGRAHVAKVMEAQVFFVPPVTWSDYFAERVRTEGGKLQIAREHETLLAAGPIATYQWSHFWRELPLREYPLVLLSQVIKGVARLWARLALTRRDFYSLYRPFSSTKAWGEVRE
jgi:hypothetical protein